MLYILSLYIHVVEASRFPCVIADINSYLSPTSLFFTLMKLIRLKTNTQLDKTLMKTLL